PRTIVAGSALAYLVDSLSYLASVLTLGFIRLPFQDERTSRTALSGRALRAEITEGLHFLWAQPHLRTMAVLSASLTLLDGPLMLAVIVLARNDLHADARTIGVIFSLAAVGELLGSLMAPRIAARLRT